MKKYLHHMLTLIVTTWLATSSVLRAQEVVASTNRPPPPPYAKKISAPVITAIISALLGGAFIAYKEGEEDKEPKINDSPEPTPSSSSRDDDDDEDRDDEDDLAPPRLPPNSVVVPSSGDPGGPPPAPTGRKNVKAGVVANDWSCGGNDPCAYRLDGTSNGGPTDGYAEFDAITNAAGVVVWVENAKFVFTKDIPSCNKPTTCATITANTEGAIIISTTLAQSLLEKTEADQAWSEAITVNGCTLQPDNGACSRP